MNLVLAGMLLTSCQLLGDGGSIESALPKDAGDTVAVVEADNNDSKEPVSFETVRDADPQSKIGGAQNPVILKKYGGAYENERLETLLAVIVGKLVAVSNDPNRAYQITVLNSPTVNAFALPGGYLYITRGLLALANDSSEVAAVLAHEMAHVYSNHGIERSKRAKAVDIADRVAKDVVSNPLVGRLAKASTERRLSAFSQGQELQADAVGIKMLGQAGFDPYAASRFLRSMERFASWRSALNSSAVDMNSSHPSTPRRVLLAERHARAFGPKGTGKRNRERFLSGIGGLIFGDEVSEGTIRGNQFSHMKSGFTFSVPQGFELNNRETAVLAEGPNQSALRFDAVPKHKAPKTAADYLKSGWVNGLSEGSVRATTVNGLSAATGTAQAGDWTFSISVVDFGGRYYRFILAAPKANTNVAALGSQIAGSFRALTSKEKSAIKPLRMQVVEAKSNDSIAGLAKRMGGVARKVELFKAINGLADGERISAGTKVKLISEG